MASVPLQPAPSVPESIRNDGAAPAQAPALRQALDAVELAFSEPARARRLAAEAIERSGANLETLSVAERAQGMAFTALDRLSVAEQHLRLAIAAAEQAALPERAGEARGSMAYLLALNGRSGEALSALDLAAPAVRGISAARVAMLRALVLTEVGRFEEALDGFKDALDVLAGAGGDQLLEADIRNNRSIAHVRLRDWRAAEADLDRAEALYLAAGQPGRTALVFHNRGFAATVHGDLPAALAAFDTAAERYGASGRAPGSLPVNRAEALLSVLLVHDAREAAEQAVAHYRHERNAVDLVQARLVLARAALLDGDVAVAADQARRARRSADRQQRPGWAALAGYLQLRARWEAGRRDRGLLAAGRRAAAALELAGWPVEAIDARLLAARTALDLGLPAWASTELASAVPVRDDDPAELRARAWHAQALLRLAEGDRRGAEDALLAGVRILQEFRASLGATELRVHAAGHTGDLARTGVRLALEAGDGEAVLCWAERWRAGALMLRPARPATDPVLARDLAELRQVTADLGGAGGSGVAGGSGSSGGGGEAARLRARQSVLEEAVRRRSLLARGDGVSPAAPCAPESSAAAVDSLRAALGSAVLVEYLAVDGELIAVVLAGSSTRLVRLGPLAAVEEDIDALRFGLRRLAGGDATRLASASSLLEHRAGRLDAVLLEALGDRGGVDHPLVIVPTGALHALPWAALPSCSGRPVSVAPSAALWQRAARVRTASGRRVFVAGPRLDHARPEVTTLAARHRGARRFTGRSSQVAAVLTALDGAQLAHIAAHGHFRTDNPLFSSLELADGPLTVYDLEQIATPPRDVVLSSCESGLSAVHPGDELLGLSAALLSMGSRSLIAAVIPVPDAAVRTLMLALHRHLRAGRSPASALARAQQQLAGAGPAERAVAAGFVCFGAG